MDINRCNSFNDPQRASRELSAIYGINSLSESEYSEDELIEEITRLCESGFSPDLNTSVAVKFPHALFSSENFREGPLALTAVLKIRNADIGRICAYRDEGAPDFSDDEERYLKNVAEISARVLEKIDYHERLSLNDFILKNIPDSVFIAARDSSLVYVNTGACRETGYSLGELLNMKFTDIDAAHPANEWNTLWGRTMKTRSLSIESYHRNNAGSIFPVDLILKAVKHENKDYICAIARNTENRKSLEEEQKLLAFALSNSPDPAYIVKRDGSFRYINEAFRKKLGYSFKDIFSLKIYDINIHVGKDEWPKFFDNLKKRKIFRLESVHKTKSGKIIPVELNSKYMKYEGEEYYTSFAKDLSAKQEIEEQLRQSHKMQAIGQLAGGIAHDFNNILGGIIGYADLTLHSLPEHSTAAANLKKILKASDRAKKLTNRILTFSRRSVEEKSPVYIGPIIKEVIELMRATIPASVNLSAKVDPETSPVFADSGSIHELIMNLCTNAYQASGENGLIKVHLSENTITEPRNAIPEKLEPGVYTVISVTDNGEGMDKNCLSRIFEPFYTTKSEKGGTGLGLSVVYGIIQSHSGCLEVESEKGSGTVFKIYIPHLRKGISPEENNEKDLTELKGSGNIIFVDDEEMLSELGFEMLSSLGYKVHTFQNGTDALKFIKKSTEEIDLLVTDHSMPGMTGLELAGQVRHTVPSVPIIMCTGFNSGIKPSDLKENGIVSLLTKPVDRKTFGNEIKTAINKNHE
ncbi:MAG: PAS domain S-box protein [Fibrobacterota bacterium]